MKQEQDETLTEQHKEVKLKTVSTDNHFEKLFCDPVVR